MLTALADTLAACPVVLDGGLATQLESQGHNLDSALWSARLLHDDPDAILQAHLAYFAAGARVATTASYQASIGGFARAGIGRAEAEQLIRRSVRLAEQARARFDDGQDRWIAGSVGPYGAALADGSEYRGDYNLSVAELREWHRPRIELLAGAGVDILALETIPCLAEVEALLAEIDGSGQLCGEPYARWGAGSRGLLARRRGRRNRGRRCQLHRSGRRGHACPKRRRIERQAGGCLSQQRRALGRRSPGLDRPRNVSHRGCRAVDQRRGTPRRWLLPCRSGADQGDW
jgi:Homocysteine S-methyltransferase